MRKSAPRTAAHSFRPDIGAPRRAARQASPAAVFAAASQFCELAAGGKFATIAAEIAHTLARYKQKSLCDIARNFRKIATGHFCDQSIAKSISTRKIRSETRVASLSHAAEKLGCNRRAIGRAGVCAQARADARSHVRGHVARAHTCAPAGTHCTCAALPRRGLGWRTQTAAGVRASSRRDRRRCRADAAVELAPVELRPAKSGRAASSRPARRCDLRTRRRCRATELGRSQSRRNANRGTRELARRPMPGPGSARAQEPDTTERRARDEERREGGTCS